MPVAVACPSLALNMKYVVIMCPPTATGVTSRTTEEMSRLSVGGGGAHTRSRLRRSTNSATTQKTNAIG